MAITLDKVKASFQVLSRVKVRKDMPDCQKMDRFLSILTGSIPAWSETDKASFKALVLEPLPEFMFLRYKNQLRELAGLSPLKEVKKTSSFEGAVKGQARLEAELAQLRADVEALKEALASKRKKKP